MTPRTRLLASLTAGLLTAAALLGAGGAAQAADTSDSQYIGRLTLTPSGGAQNSGFFNISTDVGCPTGYTRQARVFLVQEGTTTDSSFTPYTLTSTRIQTGLTAPITFAGVNNMIGGTFEAFFRSNGVADTDVLLVCEKSSASATDPLGVVDFRYFAAHVRWDNGAGTWTVVADSSEPDPEPVVPTVSLSGVPVNDGTVRVTATVKKTDGSTATDATGDVVFEWNNGGTATVDVTNGMAEFTSGVLDANSSYTFSARYVGGTDPLYEDSADDPIASVSVTTVEEPQPPQSTGIQVVIPSTASGLKFTITPGAVSLSAPELQSGSWVSTGTLGTVTVSDNRAVRPAWNLNGKVTDFTTAAPVSTIDGQWLGWTPELTGTGNKGTAGAAVVPGAANGLKTEKPLASGASDLLAGDTAVRAQLRLAAPGATPAGAYSATLTLTLI